MALFDSIIGEAQKRFGLDGKAAGALVAALVGLIADQTRGGFGGFINRFRNAGLGDTVNSWITTGDNTPISNEQVESALGEDTITTLAGESGVDRNTATSALSGIIPQVVDRLTPDGEVPDEKSLLSQIGDFLTGWGGAAAGAVAGGLGAAGTAVGNVTDKARDAARSTFDSGADAVRSGSRGVGEVVRTERDGGAGGTMKWLLPLLLLGLLILLGFWFCSRTPTTTTPANTTRNNANANANARTMPANSNSAGTAANTSTEPARTLSEVSLPNGTKLQAYPGGIEDQLVKFMQSEEYKNGTNEQLKDKWFNFDDLNFVFGKTELAPESKRQLDNIVAILKAFPDAKIKIGGYTDKKGDDAANLKLSSDRAKSVQTALQNAGVGAQVPEAEGYGEQFATVDENASDEARKADRRTAIRLIK